MSKGQNIKLLLELDDLVNSGSTDSKRIAELRTALGIKKSVKSKFEFPEANYFRMKAMGITDLEASFLLGLSSLTISDFKKENSERLYSEAEKHANHYIVEKYKRRISKGIK